MVIVIVCMLFYVSVYVSVVWHLKDGQLVTWEDFVLNPLTRWESQLDEVCPL